MQKTYGPSRQVKHNILYSLAIKRLEQRKLSTMNKTHWHLLLGARGETLAKSYLQKQGFTIIEQNWRHEFAEVDIIASHGSELHFIEVKTKSNDVFGMPEERITQKKLKTLARAAEAFLEKNSAWQEVIFDVLSVMLQHKQQAEFFLIEDVRINPKP